MPCWASAWTSSVIRSSFGWLLRRLTLTSLTTISLTFLLGGLMAGAAGLIFALYQTTIWYFQGFTAGLIAFTAAVMGYARWSRPARLPPSDPP